MLCRTSLFIFSLCRHVTFYKTLMSLSTVFVKAHVGLLQLLKWPCRTSFFTHVEPYTTDYVQISYNSAKLQQSLIICHEFIGQPVNYLQLLGTTCDFWMCLLLLFLAVLSSWIYHGFQSVQMLHGPAMKHKKTTCVNQIF